MLGKGDRRADALWMAYDPSPPQRQDASEEDGQRSVLPWRGPFAAGTKRGGFIMDGIGFDYARSLENET